MENITENITEILDDKPNYIHHQVTFSSIVIEQKGMTFDHDFGSSFPPFLFPKKKREEEKMNG